MKTRIILASSLLLSAAALAQTSAPASEAPVTGAERARHNYLSVGPAYSHSSYDFTLNGVDASDSAPENFGGVVFNYGRLFGESSVGVHEIGAEVAVRFGGTKKNDTTTGLVEMPFLASYNYNFKLGEDTRLYLGPRVGFSAVGLSIKNDPANFDQSDGDIAGKFGAGIGVKHNFTKLFGMAVGYEYSRTTSTDFNLRDSGTSVDAKVGAMNTHLIFISAAWTF